MSPRHPSLRLVPSLAVALAGAACAPSAERDLGPPAEAAAASAPRTLARGQQSGVGNERTFVARTEQEWRELWRAHASLSLPPPPLPEVDFEREMVAGIVLAEQPSAGYGVEIERAERIGDRLVLHARATEPPADAMQAAVITKPFHFVALPRQEGPVEFDVR